MHPRERFDYTSPFRRPPLKTGDGTRLIIWPVVNIEEWEIERPMPRHASPPPGGVTGAVPDMPNWTWHEYGMCASDSGVCSRLSKSAISSRPSRSTPRSATPVRKSRCCCARCRLGIHGALLCADVDPQGGRSAGDDPAVAGAARELSRISSARMAQEPGEPRHSTRWIMSPRPALTGSGTGFSTTSHSG